MLVIYLDTWYMYVHVHMYNILYFNSVPRWVVVPRVRHRRLSVCGDPKVDLVFVSVRVRACSRALAYSRARTRALACARGDPPSPPACRFHRSSTVRVRDGAASACS